MKSLCNHENLQFLSSESENMVVHKTTHRCLDCGNIIERHVLISGKCLKYKEFDNEGNNIMGGLK